MTRINAKPPFRYGYVDVLTPSDLGISVPKQTKNEPEEAKVEEKESGTVETEHPDGKVDATEQEIVPDYVEVPGAESEFADEIVHDEQKSEVTSLEDAGFSQKSVRDLKQNDIDTVEKLEKAIEEIGDLEKLQKIGKKGAETILKELEEFKARG